MILKKVLKLITLISIIFYSNTSFSSESTYFVDMNFIMNNSLAGKSIKNQLNEKNKINNNNFKKTEEILKNEEAKLVSQKNLLNEVEYKKKIKLFQKKVSDYQDKRSNTFNATSKMKEDAQVSMVNTLTSILSEYAEKNSISYIIPKKSIIIGKTELDLTNIILNILDTKVKDIKLK
jgi:outer membrane protein